MSDVRGRIVRGVVAALAVGGTVAGAIVAASQQEGVAIDVGRAETRAAVVEAAGLLRQLGHGPEAIKAELAAKTRAPRAELDPVVSAAWGKVRDPSTLRSETVAVAYSAAQAAAAGAAWAEALCRPLALLPALSEAHSACLASQADLGGAPACVDGGPVGGYVAEMRATPAQAERLRAALAGLASVGTSGDAARAAAGLTDCPDGG